MITKYRSIEWLDLRYSSCSKCGASDRPIRYLGGIGVICVDCLSKEKEQQVLPKKFTWRRCFRRSGNLDYPTAFHAVVPGDYSSLCGKLDSSRADWWSKTEDRKERPADICKQCEKLINKYQGDK